MFWHSPRYRALLQAALPDADRCAALAGARVLVTGAGGLIGGLLTEALLALPPSLGVRVTAAVHDPARAADRFAEYAGDARFSLCPYDLRAPLSGDAAYDYILHAAAPAHPAVFAADPAGTLLTSVLGVSHLADYGLSHGLRRLLYVSSGEVYGRDGDESGFGEADYGYVDVLSPRACYPIGKRAAENLLACRRAQDGLDFVIARPSHTYGPTQTERDSRAAAQFLRLAASGRDLALKSAGLQLRSYLFASDCALGILTALLSGGSGEAYNVANRGAVVTIAQFAEAVAREAGVGLRFEQASRAEQAGYTPNLRGVLKPDKLEALGFCPRFDVPAGVRETLAVLRGE